MTTFEKRIKALRAEVEALKAVKSKSSTTIKTQTKTATGYAEIYRDEYGGIITLKAPLFEIIPTTNEPFLFYASQPPYNERGQRTSSIEYWMAQSGNSAVVIRPGESPNDSSIPVGGTRTITLTANIIATADFTISVSQLVMEEL